LRFFVALDRNVAVIQSFTVFRKLHPIVDNDTDTDGEKDKEQQHPHHLRTGYTEPQKSAHREQTSADPDA
jgi:hypothetical protein